MTEPYHPATGSGQGPGNFFEGVFFTEASPNARLLGPVHVEISRQNSNLFEVKAQLAAQVRSRGGNALVNFRYGQRAHRGLKLLAFKWDTESWHGEGDAALL
jgi:hypothetical protein